MSYIDDSEFFENVELEQNRPSDLNARSGDFIEYNRNPLGKRTNDCVIRAISTALGEDYQTTKKRLHQICLATKNAHHYNDMRVIEKALVDYPCVKQGACEKGKSRWDVSNLQLTYNKGIYIVSVAGHLTCVINGALVDTWDCSYKTIYRIWTVAGPVPDLVNKKKRFYL